MQVNYLYICIVNQGKLKNVIMKTQFYSFDQNNSGGYFDVNENVTHRVIIEATSKEHAEALFEPMIEDQSGSCPCCGDRWYVDADLIDIDTYSKKGYPISVYTHYKDFNGRFNELYGKFKTVSTPEIKSEYGSKKLAAMALLENIEDYAQLMANAYPWCAPDVIIHYLDGTKKQIFSVKPTSN